MILQTKNFQSVCKTILEAVEDNSTQLLNDSLEIVAKDKLLCLNVTNREYFVTVRQKLDTDETFRAVVYAPLFLTFISKVTTQTIELVLDNNSLVVKANGNYKFPLLFDVDKMVELPKIEINNKTLEFNISADKLTSLLTYNKKEIDAHETLARPVQKMYYLDEQGCITFTTGACVNTFNLSNPLKILLTGKVVKLFKFFKTGDVKFTLGYDADGNITRQKVRFETSDVTITALLVNDNSLVESVPVKAIRALASKNYPYTVNISRQALIETITRLQLFVKGLYTERGTLAFGPTSVTVYDKDKANKEEINYINTSLTVESPYEVLIDLNVLQSVIENCTEQHLSISFGDGSAIVISRGNVKNIIPQLH